MKVLITGAAGRLGRWACRKFAAAGYEVHGTDMVRRPRIEAAKFTVADLCGREAVYALMDGADVVCHLGNHPNPASGDAQRVYSENTAMNINVLQAAWETGVPKILFASSVQACSGARPSLDAPSEWPYLPVDGDVPARPRNYYGASKEAGERLLACYCRLYGLSGVALRFPSLLNAERLEPVSQGKACEIKPFASWKQINYDEHTFFLAMADAASLLVAYAKASWAGMRVCFPTARENAYCLPKEEVVRRVYAGVPHRTPMEAWDGLTDLTAIRADTGWQPQPAPVVYEEMRAAEGR